MWNFVVALVLWKNANVTLKQMQEYVTIYFNEYKIISKSTWLKNIIIHFSVNPGI